MVSKSCWEWRTELYGEAVLWKAVLGIWRMAIDDSLKDGLLIAGVPGFS